MPVIFYTYYTPISQSISVVNAQEHTLGRKLLAKGLGELYNIRIPVEEIDSVLRITPKGKPFLNKAPDIFFNISHCDGLVVCAFHNHPIGADAELPGYFPEVLIDRALSKQEKDFLQKTGTTPSLREEWFYRLWTLKEAYVKKSGIGIDTNLTDFSFSFTQSNDNIHVICSDISTSCYQVKLSHGQIISLCFDGINAEITLISCFLPPELKN